MTRSRQTADWGSRAGLAKVIPSSVAVGSGTGSADSLGTVTFSGCSSVSVNNCFSSTYENYRIVIKLTGGTAAANLNLRLRASGTDASTNYAVNDLFLAVNGTNAGQGGTESTRFRVGYISNSSTQANGSDVILYSPFTSTVTSMTFQSIRTGDAYYQYGGGLNSNTTSYDGITIFASSGNITGTITVYGHN